MKPCTCDDDANSIDSCERHRAPLWCDRWEALIVVPLLPLAVIFYAVGFLGAYLWRATARAVATGWNDGHHRHMT